MDDKKASRLRRARRTRIKIRSMGENRLCVHRTPRHIYAQVIAGDGGTVIAAASSLEKNADLDNGGNKAAAGLVGKLIAERAKEAGVSKVAFDRSGFKFHGRIKELADAAREAGLEF